MRRRSVWLTTAAAVLLLCVSAVTNISAEPMAMEEDALHAGSARHVPGVSPGMAPTPAPNDIIHVVQPGDTLGTIARRYGVNVWDLARYNDLANPDRILNGQTLRIPRPGNLGPEPTPLACLCEEIVIQSPGYGYVITSPVTVSGLASSLFEQAVMVAILDSSGTQVGLAPAKIVGAPGKQGTFRIQVPFAAPTTTQPGRIQVYTTSPRDGALEHLSSTSVMLLSAGDR